MKRATEITKGILVTGHRGMGVIDKPRSYFLSTAEADKLLEPLTEWFNFKFPDQEIAKMQSNDSSSSMGKPTLSQELGYNHVLRESTKETTSYPENSIAAFKEAIIQGAHALECDIHVSKDNQPMVIHGNKLSSYAFDLLEKQEHVVSSLKENSPLISSLSQSEIQERFILKDFDLVERKDETQTREDIEQLLKEKSTKDLLINNSDRYSIPTLTQLLNLVANENKSRLDQSESLSLLKLNIELKGAYSAAFSLATIWEFYHQNPDNKKYLPVENLIFLGRYETREIIIMREILNSNFHQQLWQETLIEHVKINTEEEILLAQEIKIQIENYHSNLNNLEKNNIPKKPAKMIQGIPDACTTSYLKDKYPEIIHNEQKLSKFKDDIQTYQKAVNFYKKPITSEELKNYLHKIITDKLKKKPFLPENFNSRPMIQKFFLEQKEIKTEIDTNLNKLNELHNKEQELIKLLSDCLPDPKDSDSKYTSQKNIIPGHFNGKVIRVLRKNGTQEQAGSDLIKELALFNETKINITKFIDLNKTLEGDNDESIIPGFSKNHIIFFLIDQIISNRGAEKNNELLLQIISQGLGAAKTNVMISTDQLYGKSALFPKNEDFDLNTKTDQITDFAKRRLDNIFSRKHNGIDISIFDMTLSVISYLKNLDEKNESFIYFMGFTASNWRFSKKEDSPVSLVDTIKRTIAIQDQMKIPFLIKTDEPGLFGFLMDSFQRMLESKLSEITEDSKKHVVSSIMEDLSHALKYASVKPPRGPVKDRENSPEQTFTPPPPDSCGVQNDDDRKSPSLPNNSFHLPTADNCKTDKHNPQNQEELSSQLTRIFSPMNPPPPLNPHPIVHKPTPRKLKL
mgnify:FL=1